MRLLNVKTLKLEEYFGRDIPKYAILSHCWGKGEVSFQDINGPDWKKLPGYIKVISACRRSEKDGLNYVWVDTCCIDKSSSAELSESINSMYKWYWNSVVCYAYLEDVARVNTESEFLRSRWFTRGWTLQELIAPAKVIFFDQNWYPLGGKSDLASSIVNITKIQEEVLRNRWAIHSMSVARKMSWAAKRKTTRTEDIAYSLLGIFDVNMPLLYGEGEKAFIRLQEQILKESDDQSLFAWNSSPQHDVFDALGILAPSPSCFLDSGDVVPIPSSEEKQPFSITNKGLHITISLSPCGQNLRIALLGCHYEMNFSGCLGIILEETSTPKVYKRVFRPYESGLRICTPTETRQAKEYEVYVVTRSPGIALSKDEYDIFLLMPYSVLSYGYKVVEIAPKQTLWSVDTQVLKTRREMPFVLIKFHNDRLDSGFFVVLLKDEERSLVDIFLLPSPWWTTQQLLEGLPSWDHQDLKDYSNKIGLTRPVPSASGTKLEVFSSVTARLRRETRLNQIVYELEVEMSGI